MNNEKKKVRKEIFSLILPIILENTFQVLAGLISIALVGRLTATDISAQGVVLRITETFNSLFRGIAIGGTVLMARYYGEGNQNKCYNVFHQTVLITAPFAVICALLLAISPPSLLKFLTHDAILLAKGQTYMRIVVCGLPFVAIMAIVTSAFQGHSNTKVPMYIAILVNIVNMFCGYMFIFGKFGFKPMGLNGAGLALVISQICGALVGLGLLFGKKYHIFDKSQIKNNFFLYNFKTIGSVYSIGIPAALESMFWQLSAIIMSKVILSYGEVYFAAYQIGIQAESITEMPAAGFGVAATALSSKALGMRNKDLFKSYFKELNSLCLKISVVTSLLLILFPKLFMSIMTDKVDIQVIGAVYVFVMGFVQIPQNLSKVYNGTLRSVGYKNAPMIISFIGIWLIRIPLAVLFTYVLKLPIISIWICIGIDQYSRFAISYFLFKRKNIEDYIALAE